MRSLLRAACVVVGLLQLQGCSACRAQIGLGMGLGADVQVSGLAHGGLNIGRFEEYGPNYGRGAATDAVYGVVGIYHDYATNKDCPEGMHCCYGILPCVTALHAESNASAANPWAFEVGVSLLLWEIRLGFNPAEPFVGHPKTEAPPEVKKDGSPPARGVESEPLPRS